MKKKIIIIISIIIGIILILLGIIHSFEPFYFTNKLLFSKQSSNEIFKEKYEDIDSINIDVDNAIINIINSEEDAISVSILSNKKNIKVKTYNKKISISVDKKDVCLFCTLNVINIYAPKTFKEYIEITNKYGHVNIDEFENASVFINNRFGNINVKQAKTIKVESNRGSVDIGKSSNISIHSSWGIANIDEVDNIYSDSKLLKMNINVVNKSININNTIGDVNIKNAVILKDSEIKLGFGKINIDKLTENTGKLTKKN